jgi:6-phosphogluconolactonase
MAQLTEHFFDSKEAMTAALASKIEAGLVQGIEQNGRAVMLVSGGSSPAPAYRHLSSLPLPWEKVSVAMVDERWVDATHEKSNEAFIKSTLLQNNANKAHFVTMKNSAQNAVEGQAECEAQYQALGQSDITILGMGPDGHTASLFPHAEGLEFGLTSSNAVCAINAKQSEVTGSITERMTLTLNGIANSRQVILLIGGEEKRAVYETAKQAGSEFDIPLRAVLNHPDIDLTVYWCP